jgi:hypothetical protein
MNPLHKILATIVVYLNFTHAAIIEIPDWISTEGNGPVEKITDIGTRTNEVFYLSGEIEYTSLSTHFFTTDYTEIGFQLNGKDRVTFGIPYTEQNKLLISLRQSIDDVARWLPKPLGNTDFVSPGDSLNFILKINQPAMKFEFWLNPNLNLTELDQDPAISFSQVTGAGVLDVDSIIMKTGQSGVNGSTTFSNIKFHYDGSTPFVIPEPKSYAIIFGLLALGLIGIRNRK